MGDRVELGRGRACRVGLPGDALTQHAAHDIEVIAAHGRDREHLNLTEPVVLEKRADVVEQTRQAALREGVHLVDQDEHVLLAGAQSAQVAVVQGRVGVLLRIDHPHEDVCQRNEAIHL